MVQGLAPGSTATGRDRRRRGFREPRGGAAGRVPAAGCPPPSGTKMVSLGEGRTKGLAWRHARWARPPVAGCVRCARGAISAGPSGGARQGRVGDQRSARRQCRAGARRDQTRARTQRCAAVESAAAGPSRWERGARRRLQEGAVAATAAAALGRSEVRRAVGWPAATVACACLWGIGLVSKAAWQGGVSTTGARARARVFWFTRVRELEQSGSL